MRNAAIALILALSGTSHAAYLGEADVRYNGGRITGVPEREHKVLKQSIEVIENEKCEAGHSGASITIPESCGFLRGLYRYTYDGGETIFEFDVTRHPGGHVFLVAATLNVEKP